MFFGLLYFSIVTYMPRYFYLSPFPRGGDSRDVKNHGSPPKGHRLCEPYKKSLMEGGLCPESIKSFHIGKDLG